MTDLLLELILNLLQKLKPKIKNLTEYIIDIK